MFQALQIVTAVLASIVMALSLAHALQRPGKYRELDRDAYFATQRSFYPGYTIGGAAEPLSILATLGLLALMPYGPAFWLTLIALIALATVHLIFWMVTQPINKHWGLAPAQIPKNWTAWRDRWELSHTMRAAFAFVAFVLLVIAVTLRV